MTHELPPTLGEAIRSAIADLESIRTPFNRDKVVWAQYVLSACATNLGEPAFEIKSKRK